MMKDPVERQSAIAVINSARIDAEMQTTFKSSTNRR
jgi:hypothetical protein